MKNTFKHLMVCGIALLVSSLGAFGASELPKSLVKMKTGTCEFTVFHADGIKPAKDVNIEILPTDLEDTVAISGSITDKRGLAKVNVVEDGRYILSVNQTQVAILQTSADAAMSAYRLVLPASGLLVGGAEGDEEEGEEEGEEAEDDELIAGAKKKKTAAIVAAAVIAGAIILIADDDDDDDEPRAEQPAPTGTPDLLNLDRVPDEVRTAYNNGNDALKRAIRSDIEAGGSGKAALQRESTPPASSTDTTVEQLSKPTPPPEPTSP